MILGLGIDSVEIERFRRVLKRRPRISLRLFSDEERAHASKYADPIPRLAARFAAKEALMKSLGVGVGAFSFSDVSVINAESGAPELHLSGGAADLSERRGIKKFMVSLTHTDSVAQAVVVAQ